MVKISGITDKGSNVDDSANSEPVVRGWRFVDGSTLSPSVVPIRNSASDVGIRADDVWFIGVSLVKVSVGEVWFVGASLVDISADNVRLVVVSLRVVVVVSSVAVSDGISSGDVGICVRGFRVGIEVSKPVASVFAAEGGAVLSFCVVRLGAATKANT